MTEEQTVFMNALLSVDRVKLDAMLRKCEASTLMQNIETLVVPVMETIGQKWESGDVALSQVYMSGKLCESVVDELLQQYPAVKRKNSSKLATVVYKDYHYLGKRIVYTLLRASGFEVVDFGHQESAETVLEKANEEAIEVLLVSTLMLNSALHIKEIVEAVKRRGVTLKVIVGGAPFRLDSELYKEVGADATCSNALELPGVISSLKEVS